MNSYEKLCKELDIAVKSGCVASSGKNVYECAYGMVKADVKEEMSLVCKLKGEAKMSDYMTGMANVIAVLAFLVAACDFFIFYFKDIMEIGKLEAKIVGSLMMVVIFIVLVYIIWFIRRCGCLERRGGYIQVAIEQVEEELRNESKLHKAKSKKKPDKKKGKRH